MPLPIVQQTLDAQASQNKKCRVFVSYSHKDIKAAEQFIKFFHLKLRGLTQKLSIAEEQVFFDRAKLLAGDEWDESIQRALEEAQYFVLLISVDSLSSTYCFSRELKIAVERSLPILQIVLDVCPWEDQPIPGDQQKRTLKALYTLPQDEHGKLRPIAAWSGRNRAAAWNSVVEQLAERLARGLAKPIASPFIRMPAATIDSHHGFTPLLPYFCNQISTVNQFNGQVSTWNRHALVILTRGLYEDNVSCFWDRLRSKNLRDHLTARNGILMEPKRFVWPFTADRKLSAKEMQSDMLHALSEALTGNLFQLNNGLSLSQWHAALPGVLPLVTVAPNQSKKMIASGLRALLDLLEQCPMETPLDRLVIAIIIEDNDLIREKDLWKALKIVGYQRAHLIDLMPLREIDESDIRIWHQFYDVEHLCRISEDTLLQKIFGANQVRSLRLRAFAKKLETFL